ncbi:phospho-N-acetylmuramoyl-pentapeptide-transferase [bacterium]|nr:phospho-N-acetylmuramoyl-pentapeptide-transferase [bacterium]MDY3756868.1 phospho-N-acetylmuramoyl-pentapeptide-transferase [Bacilli bacterium]
MLILAKSILGLMLGFVLALIAGFILIPLLKKLHIGQSVSHLINARHLKKDGTPTIGGLIFIIPTILIMLLLYFRKSVDLSPNLIILMFVFLSYGLLGFVDDFLKVRYHNNKGLPTLVKLALQTVIAIVFYIIFKNNGGESTLVITSLGLNINLGWAYGLFILLVLVGTTNAVNITDGLDGLAGGLSALAFMAYGVIAWGTTWLSGYQDIAIFSFVLVGSLIGFLFFNAYPAKVFMGDTGSLALGAALATIAILTRHELSLILIGGVFVVETLSSLIQIIAIRKFHTKVFKKAPLHHHFEELGWAETDIVRIFWTAGFLLSMIGIIYGVWL